MKNQHPLSKLISGSEHIDRSVRVVLPLVVTGVHPFLHVNNPVAEVREGIAPDWTVDVGCDGETEDKEKGENTHFTSNRGGEK